MRAARIALAIEAGLLDCPDDGRIAVWRPVAGDDLSALPKGRVCVLTGFRPDHDHFAAAGYETLPAPPHAAGLVCLPRARDHARALLAEAAASVRPGGPVLVDGQKTDGIDAILRELRGRVALSPALAKAHGRIGAFPAGPELADWAARPRPVAGGFVTLPGVFSADGPDPGSVLLAAALPPRPGARVVDLGAGWGYLARAILAREGVERLDLVEAERDALDCARLNVDDTRARFFWEDARRFRPEGPVDAVVTNPPFHAGRAADPALGLAFIEAARRMLTARGTLWLVANRHLPYDGALSRAFREVDSIGGDAAYRLWRASGPRRASA